VAGLEDSIKNKYGYAELTDMPEDMFERVYDKSLEIRNEHDGKMK
jgi:hypothetical protein